MLLRRWTGPRGSGAELARKLEGPEPVQRPRYLRANVERVKDQQALDAVEIPRRIQDLGTQGPHLVSTEPSVPTPQRSEAVLDRWRFRDELRRVQPRRLQRSCGVQPCGPVYIGPGWQRGLCTCHSVHACPVCSARLRHVRTVDVDDVNRWWRDTEKGSVGMLTLTVRHAHCDSLEALRRGLSESWRALWQCRHGQKLRRQIEGYTRAVDVTYGPNGWHPHLHNLLYHRGGIDAQWLAELSTLWCSVVRRIMGSEFVPRDDDVGVHWKADPPRAYYINKLGLEAASIATKAAAEGHSTVWDVARAAIAEDQRKDISHTWRGLWREWSEGMLGARQLTWSRGFRKRAGLAIELDPEQLDLDLELNPESPNDWIAAIHPQDWSAVFGNNAPGKKLTSSRRPSVLLRRTVRGIAPTMAYFSRVGLIPARTHQIEVDGRRYLLIKMRQRSVLELLGRMQE